MTLLIVLIAYVVGLIFFIISAMVKKEKLIREDRCYSYSNQKDYCHNIMFSFVWLFMLPVLIFIRGFGYIEKVIVKSILGDKKDE